MSERLLHCTAIWAAVLWGLWLLRRRSPMHPLSLALVATALVGTFYPLATLLVSHTTWRNMARAPDALLLATQRDYLAWALGLAAAAFCAPRRRARQGGGDRGAGLALSRHRDLVVASGLVLCGAALYALYVQRVGLGPLVDRSNYAEKYRVSSGLGPLASGLKVMIAGCLWAEGGRIGPRARTAFRLVAAGIAVWTIGFISVRNNLVLLLGGYGCIACWRHGIELRRVRPALVVLVLAAWIGLEGFSLFRGAFSRYGDVTDAMASLGQYGSQTLASAVGGSELSHPFVTTMEVRTGMEGAELAGASYLAAVSNLVPLALHPDRAPVLSETFVWRFYPDFASDGGGTAFSQVAEAWLNFGPLIGPFLVAAAIGFLLVAIERSRERTPDGMMARLAPVLPFLVVILHRSEAATLLKQLFVMAAPAAVLWLVAEASWLALGPRRRHSGAASAVLGPGHDAARFRAEEALS